MINFKNKIKVLKKKELRFKKWAKKRKVLLFHVAALILLVIIVLAIRLSVFQILFPEHKFNKMLDFSKEDKILILAPHPDDEAIAAAGIIQHALKAGAKVKIVVLTNGDANQEAFFIYEKRPLIFQRQFINAGELRYKESINGMEYLGLSKDDLIYLGYPDFGTLNILLEHWGDVKPYRSPITRLSEVPYHECFSPGSPYTGESILKDLDKIILDFKPTRIFVSSPVDLNKDHRALYLFLKISLWNLEGKISEPEVFSYIVHSYSWPLPKGNYPNLQMTIPPKLTGKEISWYSLDLTNDEVNTKYKAILLYKSQIEYKPAFLISFARKNELFGNFVNINLNEQPPVDLNSIKWQEVELMQNQNLINENTNFEFLEYALMERNLYIKLTLKRTVDEDLGITLHLIGFNKNKNFADMPKIHIAVGLTGMKIIDKKQEIFIKDAKLSYSGKSLIMKIPVSALGDPDFILSNAETRAKDLPYDATAWRVIEINK